MGRLCRNCYKGMSGGNIPPVRTQRGLCQQCANPAEEMTFDYPDALMPNNPDNPNNKSEREAKA